MLEIETDLYKNVSNALWVEDIIECVAKDNRNVLWYI